MWAMDLYYQYLNAGFHLPIGAGTDKMGEGIPVGSNRLYARITDAPSYDAWLAGLKEGNGFAKLLIRKMRICDFQIGIGY